MGKFQIDGRLAAARDAEKKMRGGAFLAPGEGVQFLAVAVKRSLLLFGERKGRLRRREQFFPGF